MFKVMAIFGTRPEALKFVPLIKEFKNYRHIFKLIICTTRQHREMLGPVLNTFNITPDLDLDIMKSNQKISDVISIILLKLDNILKTLRPQLVMVQGDTTSAFASALAAFYHGIRIAHIEAGLRTQNKNVPFPEEMNRRLITTLADFHFSPSKLARMNLIQEGISKKQILVSGNTGIDTLIATLQEKNYFDIPDIDFSKKIIILTTHRRESFGEPLRNICEAIKKLIRNNPDIEIIVPVHFNPNVKNLVMANLSKIKQVKLIPPLEYKKFIYLMSRCYLLLTDSGGIQEEAPYLGKPALILREETERKELIDMGTAKLVGTNADKIVSETQKLLDDKKAYKLMAKLIRPYGNGQASKRIISFLIQRLK